MKDANGQMLVPGDSILLPCIIRVMKATALSTELTLEVNGKPIVESILSDQVFRANPGDAANSVVAKVLAAVPAQP